MAFKTFSLLIIIRTSLIILALLILVGLLNAPGYHMASLLCALVVIALCYDLVRFVNKTNNELVRFLQAVRFADFSQRFELQEQGAGFEELGETFAAILHKLQDNRQGLESRIRYLTSVVEQVPVPLLSASPSGEVQLLNFSARKLFGQCTVQHLDDFAQFGNDALQQINRLKPGEPRLVRLVIEGMEHRMSVNATSMIVQGQQSTLISLQDIQNELDFAQMEAWQDLVKVLTHEIMNSITPVASLSKTAVDLVADVRQHMPANGAANDALEELHFAVDTVSRRSDNLIDFVGSYRKLTRIPEIRWQKVDIAGLFDVAKRIALQDQHEETPAIDSHIVPANLQIDGDKALLEQVLINLIKNACQAGANQIGLHAYINRRGHGVIEVLDNGSGIDDSLLSQIFVPFFTTKREGSGVGLALTRQVMIAHKGSVKVENTPSSGACFTLTF